MEGVLLDDYANGSTFDATETIEDLQERIAKLSHSQNPECRISASQVASGIADTHIPKIKAQIAKLEEEHKINNGLSIDECGYEECIDRDIRTKLRAKLAKEKKT
jgi:formate-dependent nitrite reductase cytochrome c552 subunit